MDNLYTVRISPRMDILDAPGWLSAARSGESWALEQFYDSYQASLYSLCYRMLGRAEDAEDATQAAFVRGFRALPNFRGDCSVKTWIYRIAVNEALNILRKRRVQPVILEESERLLTEARDLAERLAVQAALARLKPDQRAILVLRFWEELSYEEIAEVLNLSLPAVRMRLKRAREAFQKRYERE